ncbi:MAG: GH3 auxin-responsive promoter family protein, partial [Chloroflexota bacterium]|nr:GH3 auxin-responsive promoter family protein [Chloroflexota bacterium]
MSSESSFFRTQDARSLWQRYCGFLDLTLEEFLQIQEHLLREQIDLVADSALGEKLLQGQRPATVEEFRRSVPLTTYRDYAPYLDAKQEDCLADMDPYW